MSIAHHGLEFATRSVGDASHPVVLCLHGFPDTHHGFFEGGDASFAHRVAAAGFHVVAPCMRGLAPGAIPSDGDYRPTALGDDVVGHIDALGGRAAVVGNDWGALAAYLAATRAPQKIERLVTLGIPHPLAIKFGLRTAWRARHFVTFQFQTSAAKKMRKNDFALVETLYRRWSPAWHFDPSVLAEVKRAYALPGVVEGALAPYAAMRRERKATEARLREKITVPTLAVAGGADPTVPIGAYERSRRGFSASYAWDVVPGVGHFPQREDPAATADRVVAFLRAN